MNILKYLKALLYILVPIIIANIIITVLYYFNLIGNNVNNYLKLFIIAFSMLTGGIYIGTKSNKNGWLEGLKIGSVIVILFFLISYLGFDQKLEIKNIIYYLILLISSTLGSMLGINKRKRG